MPGRTGLNGGDAGVKANKEPTATEALYDSWLLKLGILAVLASKYRPAIFSIESRRVAKYEVESFEKIAGNATAFEKTLVSADTRNRIIDGPCIEIGN
jgi:hypothetical protein